MGAYQPQTRISANGKPVDDTNPLPVAMAIAAGTADADKPMTEATGQALIALIGDPADAAGDPTVIGLLKQIAANTAA